MTTHQQPRPTPRTERWDRLRMLQLIEDAERATRLCLCGAQMRVDVSDDTLWLECPTFGDQPDGHLAWLRSGLREVLHDRRALVTGIGRAA